MQCTAVESEQMQFLTMDECLEIWAMKCDTVVVNQMGWNSLARLKSLMPLKNYHLQAPLAMYMNLLENCLLYFAEVESNMFEHCYCCVIY